MAFTKIVGNLGTLTGIVTIAPSSNDSPLIKVGTALTLGHTQGLQFHTQNLHANGFEVNNINVSGIVTASSFSGDGIVSETKSIAYAIALG